MNRTKRRRQIPEEMQRDDTFGRDLDGFGPELEFGMNAAANSEVLGLRVKRTDRRVMADLLADHTITQLFPSRVTHTPHTHIRHSYC